MPYGVMRGAQYPALLTDINARHVEFSVFDGDLKAGGDGPCADSLYTTALAAVNMLDRPLVGESGDNDWTDCWGRYGASQLPFFDPFDRHALERVLFASTDQSLRSARGTRSGSARRSIQTIRSCSCPNRASSPATRTDLHGSLRSGT